MVVERALSSTPLFPEESAASVLQRINLVINTTLDLQEVLRRIVNEIVVLLRAQSASVILYDRQTGEAELMTTYGQGSALGSLRYPLAGSLAGWVAAHQQPLRVFRLTPEEWPGSWQLAVRLGEPPDQVSVLMVPLCVQGSLIGCLETVWKPCHTIVDQEELLLQAISVQAAIAITNARLYQEKEQALQETQHAAEALRASEARYRALAENTYDLICELDQEGRYIYVSPNYRDVVGYTPEELLGQVAFDLIHPDDLARVLLEFGKSSGQIAFRFLHKEGEWRWFESTGKEYCSPLGEIRGVIVSRDITARKHAEERLKEEIEIATALARAGQAMIASLDTPLMLERLCRLTVEELNCDCSYTLLRQPQENIYVPVAHHGEQPEQWETVRLVRIPHAFFSAFLARLQERGVVPLNVASQQHTALGRACHHYGLTAFLCMALRRGNELIGVQVAASRTPGTRYTARQRRIARGLAQLASFALANASLLEELTRANRLKEHFVGAISHELRTPLNIILGYNQLMREETFGLLNSEQQEILGRVDKNARELLDLINAVLDLSRLQSRQVSLALADVQVPSLLDELQTDMNRLRKEGGPRVEWAYTPDLPLLQTDVVKLRMVLKNLLTNALKFTQEGIISVTAHPRGMGVEFSIADTGVGITAEDLPYIFEAFRQGVDATPHIHGGVGLGLYIVRQLLDLLGGSISVKSERGKGSIFRVWVPQKIPGSLFFTTPTED
jgi:PAS domain S-box-containing protein